MSKLGASSGNGKQIGEDGELQRRRRGKGTGRVDEAETEATSNAAAYATDTGAMDANFTVGMTSVKANRTTVDLEATHGGGARATVRKTA